jgi:hypothetical protein
MTSAGLCVRETFHSMQFIGPASLPRVAKAKDVFNIGMKHNYSGSCLWFFIFLFL